MEYLIQMESAEVRSPEAEELTGTPQHLQRDWRRRGLLADYTGQGQVRYPLWQVAQLKVMMILSAAHIAVKPARFVIMQVADMVTNHIRTSLDACEFIGADLSDADKLRIMREKNPHGTNDFYMLRLPELPEGDQRASYLVSSTWTGLHELAVKERVSAAIVIDAAAIAREIIAAAKRPLVTYRLTPLDGGTRITLGGDA